MSIPQTLLIYVGSPAAIIAAITAAVYGRSMVHQPTRYRPGRGWDYKPAWYSAHPEALTVPAVNPGSTTATGGASGEW